MLIVAIGWRSRWGDARSTRALSAKRSGSPIAFETVTELGSTALRNGGARHAPRQARPRHELRQWLTDVAVTATETTGRPGGSILGVAPHRVLGRRRCGSAGPSTDPDAARSGTPVLTARSKGASQIRPPRTGRAGGPGRHPSARHGQRQRAEGLPHSGPPKRLYRRRAGTNPGKSQKHPVGSDSADVCARRVGILISSSLKTRRPQIAAHGNVGLS